MTLCKRHFRSGRLLRQVFAPSNSSFPFKSFREVTKVNTQKVLCNLWRVPKNMLRTTCILFCTLLAALCVPFGAHAQDSGSVTGTVRDTSGAVVPNAEVKFTSSAIGMTRTTTTNDDGDYLGGALPPGSYDLTVTAKGFKAYQAKKIIVRVAEKARVDVTPGTKVTSCVKLRPFNSSWLI